ncbi:MAG: glycosyltransferase family 9 protein [Blastocatellia bacterium]|nr:glycosyltransferase family 9 protein [Blastocatellia bacterium]
MEFEPRNILVLHVAGLAETILALPALRSLRSRLPHARITVVSSAGAAELLEQTPEVDEVLPMGRLRNAELLRPTLLLREGRTLGALRRGNFDAAIEFKRNTESGILLRLLNLPARRGAVGIESVIERIRQSLAPRPPAHVAQQYLKRLEPWDVRPIESAPRLPTSREADARIERLLEKYGVRSGEMLVGLHPGAGTGRPRWPLERFASIGARLIHNFNARAILLAGPNERGIAKRLAAQLPAKKSIVMESPRMADWISIAARMSLFIGHAGGPAHLAAAAGAPVVALSIAVDFSPQDLLGPRIDTLRAPHLQLISEEAVYESACKLLQMNRAEALRAR